MKLTLNHVLDWMQQLDPNGTFDELKDRTIEMADAKALDDILRRWEEEADTEKFWRTCRRMRHAAAIHYYNQSRLLFHMRVGICYAMKNKLPVYITNGSVTRCVIYVSALERTISGEECIIYKCDDSLQHMPLMKTDDCVLSFYADVDHPDGYLMIEPEWYSKL